MLWEVNTFSVTAKATWWWRKPEICSSPDSTSKIGHHVASISPRDISASMGFGVPWRARSANRRWPAPDRALRRRRFSDDRTEICHAPSLQTESNRDPHEQWRLGHLPPRHRTTRAALATQLAVRTVGGGVGRAKASKCKRSANYATPSASPMKLPRSSLSKCWLTLMTSPRSRSSTSRHL